MKQWCKVWVEPRTKNQEQRVKSVGPGITLAQASACALYILATCLATWRRFSEPVPIIETRTLSGFSPPNSNNTSKASISTPEGLPRQTTTALRTSLVNLYR